MYFDTHCHLNFKAFKKNLPEVLKRARKAGVEEILIPGTNVKTSHRAIEIAGEYAKLFVATGIHPHHVFDLYRKREKQHRDKIDHEKHDAIVPEAQEESVDLVTQELYQIEELLNNPHVVAVGEIGLDRHMYQATKYSDYVVDAEFVALQQEILKKQIFLAIQYKKSVVFHNREARDDLLSTLNDVWDESLRGRAVFHCCESHHDLLSFALDHDMFIGVDGDISYDKEKQSFIKEVPLDNLVIETDAPFILPEPFRSRKEYPNEPRHVVPVAEWVARVKEIAVEEVAQRTRENGMGLFSLF